MLLQSWQGNLFNSGAVTEIETMLDTLKMKAVSVVHTKKISKMDREISEVQKKLELLAHAGIAPPRPR